MIEKDTVRLLRECDAGIKMGIESIDEVIPSVRNKELKELLDDCRDEHSKLMQETTGLLEEYGDEGKEPNVMAKGMSWLKTNVMLGMDASDATVADLMTDGCNMGVKSLSKYLNKYAAADEKSKDITKRLITVEERLSVDMRDFL